MNGKMNSKPSPYQGHSYRQGQGQGGYAHPPPPPMYFSNGTGKSTSPPKTSVSLSSSSTSSSSCSHLEIKSQSPLIVRVKLKNIPLGCGLPRSKSRSNRSSGRIKRKSYTVDSDDDLFESTSDNEMTSLSASIPHKKRIRLNKGGSNDLPQSAPSPLPLPLPTPLPLPSPSPSPAIVIKPSPSAAITYAIPNNVDSPPPGILPSLWYSRECFFHVFVMEKILGWKTRKKINPSTVSPLTLEEINEKLPALSLRVVDHVTRTGNSRLRMEVSRVNPSQCPVTLLISARSVEADGTEESEEREQVILIKWRGKSYLHCSWERPKDLERFDPSNNNSAKGKIKRFYQSKEILLGTPDWRKVMEESRQSNSDKDDYGAWEDGFYPPDFVEAERILACDEKELDMNVLTKQKATNAKLQSKSQKSKKPNGAHLSKEAIAKLLPHPPPEAWDPEDNVRYVVKWKGLQTSDVTWEYWKDIKYDFVDTAQDFWYRQRAPSAEVAEQIVNRPMPHVRDFKKLNKSPTFGKSDQGEEDDTALRLRSYQLEGVNWLLWNWYNKRSCCLADEMGLGKTIQSVTFLSLLAKIRSIQVRGPFLIVAPLSLLSQWQSEAEMWVPDMNVLVYHGSADARDFLVREEFFYTEQFIGKTLATKLRRMHFTKFQMMITTYEVVLKDIAVLSKIKWRALVVDEAHRLKNLKSRLFIELATVPRDFCLLLTGTPLQNSTEELFALLHFSDPINFCSKDAFIEKFGQLTDAQQVRDLHSVLKPYLLRRVKEDVEKSLPPKEETILEVTLTPIQKQYYKAIYERNTTFLFKGSKPANGPSLMNIMMELRKCCNHPFLIRGAEERILAETKTTTREEYTNQLIQSSGKMVLLAKLLPKLDSGGHKVLIFSQMVRALDLLEELLRIRQHPYERLDGSTSASNRRAAVDRFCQKTPRKFVMLLSTRAGGLGLNLTAADTVVIFDSDWNPQNDLQAMARAHRIGQTRPVRVYRLLTAKTYEMHMFHSASMKLGLDRAVLAHQRQTEQADGADSEQKGEDGKKKLKNDREMQAKEIDELLKKGAYDVFRDDDDEGQKFMETDIDQLLEQSSRKVTYGSNSESMSAKGLGSFSKASFVTSTDGKDVDLDDPDFWEKAIGFDQPNLTDSSLNDILGEKEKRSRKQVQVFDPYAAFAEAEQKKKDKVTAKLQQEKKERERLRKEKKIAKLKEKEDRRRQRDKSTGKKIPSNSSSPLIEWSSHGGGGGGGGGSGGGGSSGNSKKALKKIRKAERRKLCRKLENEDPPLEKLKHAWESSHRDRVISAVLRFGFGRFCKLRVESGLTSLPIQDLEVFVRQYMFQLGLQASVSLLNFQNQQQSSTSHAYPSQISNKTLIKTLIKTRDGHWILNAVQSSLKIHKQVTSHIKTLYLPKTLTSSSFLNTLRSNFLALRYLRRIAVLSHISHIVETALDVVLSDLGTEELGKRGCPSPQSPSSLDPDLKARYVTTEELSCSLSYFLPTVTSFESPAPWWDRGCDVGLIIGTFIHGLGRYDRMRLDAELPFLGKMERYAQVDSGAAKAFTRYNRACEACKVVLEHGNIIKEKKEDVTAVVTEETTPSAEIVPEATVEEIIGDAQMVDVDVRENMEVMGKEEEVTLQNLVEKMMGAIRKEVEEEGKNFNKDLPMPDSVVLDGLLCRLMDDIEKESGTEYKPKKRKANEKESPLHQSLQPGGFYDIGGSVLDDGSNYRTSAVSPSLLSMSESGAQNPSSHCRLRGPGVPLHFTRYAITALIHAEDHALKSLAESSSEPSSMKSSFWRDQPTLRSKLCIALLKFGCPPTGESSSSSVPPQLVHPTVWNALYGYENAGQSRDFFTMADLIRLTTNGSEINDDACLCDEYVNDVLLPHCLRLCVSGSDNRTQKAGEENQSDLPDPYLPLSQHSPKATAAASCLLRRSKLMKAVRFVVGGGVPVDFVLSFLRGNTMRRNLDGLPVWWCPWIHDLSLLVYASTRGLLTLTLENHISEQIGSEDAVFSKDAIQRHIRAVFLEGRDGMKPALPRCFLNRASKEELNMWVNAQCQKFPSPKVIERRVALICAELTTTASKMDGMKHLEWRYDDIPMFDHGGWPTNEEGGCRLIYGSGGGVVDVSKSLLCTIEDDAVALEDEEDD